MGLSVVWREVRSAEGTVSYAEPAEVARMIGECQSPGAKIMLALAFYCDPSTYGVSRAGVRQVGQAAPIDRDLGLVARAVLEGWT